jgi:hypothetical protein
MLEDNSLTELQYLKFLHNHAGLFFQDEMDKFITISEFQFGSDYRADFVVCNDRSSYGFEYEFIEIESPTDNVYTKKGNPSSHLTEAINQIQQWRLWIDANRAEAKRILPSKSFLITDEPAFKYTIIIGRREKTEEYLHLRNYFGKQLDIEIRSFDYLTKKLLQRRFDSTPIICSAQFENLDFITKNKLANPFVKAFKSSVWKKMVQSPKFYIYHMITMNIETILNKREINLELQNCFLDEWSNLEQELKEIYFQRAKELE